MIGHVVDYSTAKSTIPITLSKGEYWSVVRRRRSWRAGSLRDQVLLLEESLKGADCSVVLEASLDVVCCLRSVVGVDCRSESGFQSFVVSLVGVED